MYAQVNRRKQRFKAKKSLITDEYEEELKTLKMWYCAYCEYEDNSQNGLKAHLSKGFHNAEDLHERYVLTVTFLLEQVYKKIAEPQRLSAAMLRS